MDQWLIRTSENEISGPFSRSQITEMIQKAQLGLEDEVCGAGQYWFYLHEHHEVRQQLGIDVPKSLYGNRQESTLTETDTEVGEITDPQNIAAMGTASTARPVVRPKDLDTIPELSELLDEIGENTAVMSNRAFRDYRQKKAPQTSTQNVNQPATAQNIQPLNVALASTVNPSASQTPNASGTPSVQTTGSFSQDSVARSAQPFQVEKSKLLKYFAILLMAGAVILILFVIRLLRSQPG